MLAALFYTRVAPESLERVRKTKGNEARHLAENTPGGTDRALFTDERRFSDASSFPPVGVGEPVECHLGRSRGAALADISLRTLRDRSKHFSNGEMHAVSSLAHKEMSLEILRAWLRGRLVRSRMRSNSGRALVARIAEMDDLREGAVHSNTSTEDFHAYRSLCVSQLILFLEQGACTSDRGRGLHACMDGNALAVPKEQEYLVKKVVVDSESPNRVELKVHSSHEAQGITASLLASLGEVAEMKGASSSVLLKDVSPNFLAKKRSLFLQTFFSVEDRERLFNILPRVFPASGSSTMDVDYSLVSLYGGGYNQIIGNIEKASAAL